jgi:hypothetical protein
MQSLRKNSPISETSAALAAAVKATHRLGQADIASHPLWFNLYGFPSGSRSPPRAEPISTNGERGANARADHPAGLFQAASIFRKETLN